MPPKTIRFELIDSRSTAENPPDSLGQSACGFLRHAMAENLYGKATCFRKNDGNLTSPRKVSTRMNKDKLADRLNLHKNAGGWNLQPVVPGLLKGSLVSLGATAGGVAGCVGGGGTGAAVGFCVGGPGGAAVGYLFGLAAGALGGALGGGLATRKVISRLGI
jgi:hypothetical protein